MIYQKNFNKLQRLLKDLSVPPETMKLKSDPYMDLSIETIHRGNGQYIIAMSHYYTQNGDLVPDPDMTVKIIPALGMVEALSYQDKFGYRAVYPKPSLVDINAKKDLNNFLGTWLSNLLVQGFKAAS